MLSNVPISAFSPSYTPTASSLSFEQLRQNLLVTRRRLDAGQLLYRVGQPFRSLFLVHAGSLKNFLLSENGNEQITAFRLRGDLLGVESIGLDTYACNAIALESGETWELNYPSCIQYSPLQAQLTAALAEEVRHDHFWKAALGTLAAKQRIAAFLLEMSARYQALGFSNKRFSLRMTRADMASYLVLKHETVSRVLSHLVAVGCLAVCRRDIEIIDREALRRTAWAAPATDFAYSYAHRTMASRTASADCSRP